MNKLCRQYLYEVKALFPIISKPERKYLKKLKATLEDYCEESEASTMDEIYKGFGSPYEIISAYLSDVDFSRLAKKIRLTKWIKRGIVIFLIAATIGMGIFAFKTYKEYNIFKEEQIYFEEESIQ